MSAPLVVNTTDGVCWTRREETRGGEALYAPEKCQACPELVMVTLTELAERGIAGSADALPVPVGPERPYDEATRELLRLRARVTELETGTERLKANLLGWSKRGRAAEDDLKSARIRVAELEARAAAGPDSVWWLAQYDGVEPELFATEAAAREFCDDHAVGEVPQWDWFADGEGVWQQVQTSDLDDRPMTAAPGSVRRMTPPGAGPLSRACTRPLCRGRASWTTRT